MSGFEEVKERRKQFLRAVYEGAEGSPSEIVQGHEVAQRLGLDISDAGPQTEEFYKLAGYHQQMGNVESLESSYGLLQITSKGVNEVEGGNQLQQPSGSTTVSISGGTFHGSVIGAHNNTELTNNFDFRSIEQQIEQDGGEDKEELREALKELRLLLESSESLDRGALARFSAVMQRHEWFSGAVMQALAGFATQAVLGG